MIDLRRSPKGEGAGPGILVGVDFSEGASRAVQEARRLAARLTVRMVLVHVAESGRIAEWEPSPRALRWMEGMEVDRSMVHLREGMPAVELGRAAREKGAGWIVLGSHGVGGTHPLALGSTAAKMALIAPCPVIVIGPRALGRTGDFAGSGDTRVTGSPGEDSPVPAGPAVSGDRS